MQPEISKQERYLSIAAFSGCFMSSILLMVIGISALPPILHGILWVAFFTLSIWIHHRFKESRFISHNARQACSMEIMALVMTLPLIAIAVIAGDDPEAFAERLSFAESIIIFLYIFVQSILFYVFVLIGSFYTCYRAFRGHEAKYLPVMLYDRLTSS